DHAVCVTGLGNGRKITHQQAPDCPEQVPENGFRRPLVRSGQSTSSGSRNANDRRSHAANSTESFRQGRNASRRASSSSSGLRRKYPRQVQAPENGACTVGNGTLYRKSAEKSESF